MKKIIITLLITIFLTSGCTIIKVSNQTVNDVLKTVLYVDNNLKNTYMNGYEFYLPKGVKIVDKKDFNLEIKDSNNLYYLYIDTIAYYYKTKTTFNENRNHYFSQRINFNNKEGYIDIVDDDKYYFIVAMYNYAKIEAYVLKEDFSKVLTNMCYLLSTIKYNDKVISDYVGDKGTVFQEERFNIFDSKSENDNFLTYEKEYGTYKDKIVNNDTDIIEIDEIVE